MAIQQVWVELRKEVSIHRTRRKPGTKVLVRPSVARRLVLNREAVRCKPPEKGDGPGEGESEESIIAHLQTMKFQEAQVYAQKRWGVSAGSWDSLKKAVRKAYRKASEGEDVNGSDGGS